MRLVTLKEARGVLSGRYDSVAEDADDAMRSLVYHHLALLCEQGHTHDPETGEPLPWTVAGWSKVEDECWWWEWGCDSDPAGRVSSFTTYWQGDVPDGLDEDGCPVTRWVECSEHAGALLCIIAAHKVLGLPPLQGVPDVQP